MDSWSADEEDGFGKSKSGQKSTSSMSNTSSSQDGQRDNTEGMESVIQVMNELYDVGHQINADGRGVKINLPQIVVCGSQSSGKTSVLECISGEEFLPRGLDIQTRCPIVLQLINTKDNTKYVEFLHARGQKFTNMDEVRHEIEQMNKGIIDSKQVVSDQPITLKLFSPNVPNLTLVDLPGLVEVPTEGQPANLVYKINELVLKYISNENSIILAISAATVDIADSKSLRLSKMVDPNGKRTIGVLTKLDLMDEGTNANDILFGRRVKLDLGIVGVVNRSHMDVQQGKSLQDQLKKEKHFLENNYPSLASTSGTPFLIKRISRLLMKCIHFSLPALKGNVEQLIEKHQEILEDIGEPKVADGDKSQLLLKLLTNFAEVYCAQVDGRRRNLETKTLNVSARIKKLFDRQLGDEFARLVAGKKLTDKEIDIAIQNSHGLHNRRINHDDAFQEFAKREITELGPYVSKCAKEVCKEMKLAVDTSCDPIIREQYPRLYQKIKQTALELINERYQDCQRYLGEYLEAEASIARTLNGGFRDKTGGYSIYSVSEDAGSKGKEKFQYVEEGYKAATGQVRLTKGKSDDIGPVDGFTNDIAIEDAAAHRAKVKMDIQLYFDAAKRQVMDHVAKGIVSKLVYGTANKITEFMLLRLFGTENAENWLPDINDDEIKERYLATQQLIQRYEHANDAMERILMKFDKV